MPLAPYLDVVPAGLNFDRTWVESGVRGTFGANLSMTWVTPLDHLTILFDLQAFVVTTSAVANRQVFLSVSSPWFPSNLRWNPSGVQAASQSITYNWSVMLSADVFTTRAARIPIAPIFLAPQSTITMSFLGNQPGDTNSEPMATFFHYLWDGSHDITQIPNPVFTVATNSV